MSISILSDVDDLMNNGDNMVIRMSAIQDNPYRENLSIEEYIQYLGVYTKVALSYAEFFQDYWYKDDVAKTNQKMIEELERVGIKGWSGMTEEEKAHILGVQANLWTEYIATPDHLHYMLLPRLAALAEVQWCQPEVKSWERFLDSADEFCGIYDIMGYRYGDHLFDTRGECVTGNGVSVVLEAQGETPIRYTLDGSEPTVDSPLYTEPVKITESCTLKARSERGGQMSGRTFEKSFTAHKAMGRPVEIITATHPNYTFNCPDLLTDGLVGEGPYNSGDFAGWYNQPFEVVADMGGAEYSEVTLSTIVFKYDWIMNPTSFTILTSEDGKNFTEVAHMDIECVGQMDDANGCQDYTLTFGQTSAKYLKVIAGCCTSLPEWHPGAGHPAFLFVDEVIVK